MKESRLERRIGLVILAEKLPKPEREFRFHPIRRWKFDFAWPDKKVALEAEGGIWINGAHTRGAHFNSDSEKYNEAVLMGWRVLRYTTNTVGRIGPDLRSILL